MELDDRSSYLTLRQIQIGWVVLVLDKQLFEDQVFRWFERSCECRRRDDRGSSADFAVVPMKFDESSGDKVPESHCRGDE